MRVHIFHRTPFLKDSKLQNGDGLVRAQLHYAMLRGNTYFLLLVFKFLLFNLFSQRCFQSLHYLQDMALKGSRWRKWSNWHERGHFSSRSVKNYQVEVSFLFLFFRLSNSISVQLKACKARQKRSWYLKTKSSYAKEHWICGYLSEVQCREIVRKVSHNCRKCISEDIKYKNVPGEHGSP